MKQPVLLMLLLSASIAGASDFKEDDWNLSNNSVTVLESASTTCSTDLNRLAKYGIRGSQKTTFKVVRPHHMTKQVLVEAQYFSLNLDKGQTPQLSRKSISNSGLEKGFFGGNSTVYIKKNVDTNLKLESNSSVGSMPNKTLTDLQLNAMDENTGVEINIPSGSRIVQRSDKSLSISSSAATVTLINVQSPGNWGGVGFKSNCQLVLSFKTFPAKKIKTGSMTRTSFNMSGSSELIPVK
jgi:hypothetical protein